MEKITKIEKFLMLDYGSGDGYGDGSGSGYGYGDGSGDGSGSGYGDGSGYGSGIKSFNNLNIYSVDGVATIINNVSGNVAKGYILNNDFTLTPCFIVKGHNYFAHGSTIRNAQNALEEKIFDDMDVDEKIEIFLKSFKLGKKYPATEFYKWHNKLTGSCEMGRNAFVSDHNIDINNDIFTVEEFIELTKNSYGSSVIRQLAERLHYEIS